MLLPGRIRSSGQDVIIFYVTSTPGLQSVFRATLRPEIGSWAGFRSALPGPEIGLLGRASVTHVLKSACPIAGPLGHPVEDLQRLLVHDLFAQSFNLAKNRREQICVRRPALLYICSENKMNLTPPPPSPSLSSSPYANDSLPIYRMT